MSRDVTALLDERRKGQKQKTIVVYGKDFVLPAAPPAAVGIQMLKMHKEQTSEEDVDPQTIIELLQDILGEKQWGKLVKLINFDEIDVIVQAVMEEMFGGGPPPKPGEGDAEGEASASTSS